MRLSGAFLLNCELFALTLLFALPLGLVVSFGSMSRLAPLRGVVKTFVWVIRGTPLMLQILVILGASGLRLVTRVLKDIDDIDFSRLTSDDVVRHSLVGRIVDAYSEYDEQRTAARHERQQAHEFANRADRRAGLRDRKPKRGLS